MVLPSPPPTPDKLARLRPETQHDEEEREYWAHYTEDDDADLLQVEADSAKTFKRKLDFTDSERPAKSVKVDFVRFMTSTCKLDDDVSRPFCIAGFVDPSDQQKLADLSTGVQWELGRLISWGKTERVGSDRLHKLRGSTLDMAPIAMETLLGINKPARPVDTSFFAAERRAKSAWVPLDLEEKTLASANPEKNLGNDPETPHGGHVCFSGTLVQQNSKVSIRLDECTIGASCRLYRQYGSSSFLRIRVSQKVLYGGEDRLRRFFLKPFVILNNVFRAFFSKEGRVVLFKTGERLRNGIVEKDPTSSQPMLFDFLDAFNPLKLNSHQLLCKWASRFALGLSSSVPGPIIMPENAEEIDDIVSSESPPAEGSIMTDGCGLTNMAFNLRLQHRFQLETMPCAVQVRQGGRKGMVLVVTSDAANTTNDPRIAFRASQVKIVYNKEAQAQLANATVDLLRFSKPLHAGRLSAEVIINLEHNGVPLDVFKRLQEAHLMFTIEDMMAWSGAPNGDSFENMQVLYRAVERSEGVYRSRRLREVAGEERIHGFELYNDGDDREEESFEGLAQEKSVAWWPDETSGQPSSLAETVMALLDSGFKPQALPVLRDKLKQLVSTKVKAHAQNFNFAIPQSSIAFVVPDHLKILEPDEIHFKSSKRDFAQDSGPATDIVLGDVLITRNPCKVPSDVRKVKAVRHREFHDVLDVIVCSVKGSRRLLDFLAGGDYDGDKCTVIWDQSVVVPFTNASDEYSIKPPAVNKNFTQDSTTVAQFIISTDPHTSPEIKAQRLQKYLLDALRDPFAIGQYSGFHDNAVLMKGYDHPESIRLAYQFCTVLDSSKTGFILKNDCRKADSQTYGHAEGPAWKVSQKKANQSLASPSNAIPLQRQIDPSNPSLARPFIMDELIRAAAQQKDKWLSQIEAIFQQFDTSPVFDPVLAAPWDNYVVFAQKRREKGDMGPRKDLDIIVKHVESMFEQHRAGTRQLKRKRAAAGTGPESPSHGHAFTNLPIESRQDALRSLSRDFSAQPTIEGLQTIPDPALLARLRASYAYRYDHERQRSGAGWSRFPWDVAFRELCQIKASALGPHKPITSDFYEILRVRRA
ncbi:Dimethylaniline monooxygenase [Mycena chlorophos]|uniref:RNA-dependent RNA polymerase n=1 Tax=Mycena chlorophos TaxID=658473 RepID=A0A8H6SKW3_MYCCL|nr:Dimethylaniline monooxygenase [Mycena chlorophos]